MKETITQKKPVEKNHPAVRKYSNGEVTVVWQPHLCIHSEYCFRGLPSVFKPRERPWINLDGKHTEKIIRQVQVCPSGALSYFINRKNAELDDPNHHPGVIIEPLAKGPLMVYGDVLMKDADGREVKQKKVTAFCRCGGSGTKPFCDGTHKKNNFNG